MYNCHAYKLFTWAPTKKNGFNRVVEPSMVYALDLLLIGDDVEEADSRWAESRSSYKNISILKSMNESVV